VAKATVTPDRAARACGQAVRALGAVSRAGSSSKASQKSPSSAPKRAPSKPKNGKPAELKRAVAGKTAPKTAKKREKNGGGRGAPAPKATPHVHRRVTPSESKLTRELARAVARLRGLEREVTALRRAVPKMVKATTKAERAAATRAQREAAKVAQAVERAEKRARTIADQLAKKQAAADARDARRRASEAAKLAAAELRAAKRAAKKRGDHPVEGCGLPYKKFKPFDSKMYGEVATAINAQRSRAGRFGKASRRLVTSQLGKMKREAFDRYQEQCAAELQAVVSGTRPPVEVADVRHYQDDVPF